MTEPKARIGSMFGKYKLTAVVGQGGMGEVYEAFDTSKDRKVALKILREQFSHDEQFRARFQRESHAVAILQEPHVIPIHDYGEIDGKLFIDMRLVRGRDLHELLREGPLEPARAVSIIAQVADALDAAHAEGLVHRDIKPQNILVTPNDFAYLVDFGIAETRGETRLTKTGTAIGSFAYMAPERFEDRPTTSAVDVYSLAGVLHEALTGSTPFVVSGFEQLIGAHLSAPPPRPSMVNPRVPAALDAVIARGMAKEPDDRYGSAGALARAAKRALSAASGSGTGTGPTALAQTMPAGPAAVGQYQPWTPAATPAPSPATTPAPSPATAPAPGTTPRWQPAQQESSRPARVWPVVTAVLVAAVVVLAAIGVVIGIIARQKSGTSTRGDASSGFTISSSAPPSYQPQTTPAPPPPPPPTVSGPDNSSVHASCDEGYQMEGATGFGSHSGRGTAETSCPFTYNVLVAYWQKYGNASRDSRTVSAPGAVSCQMIAGAVCDGDNFVMQCAALGSDPWITCTGGNDAKVYLY